MRFSVQKVLLMLLFFFVFPFKFFTFQKRKTSQIGHFRNITFMVIIPDKKETHHYDFPVELSF